MSEFTKGPWRIAGKGTIRAGDGWIGRIHWHNRDANASLIAAAPDMYEALKSMLNLHLSHHNHPIHAAARAALAKANGHD
ncbi:MAG TPA: hypothetical protein DCY10_05305 [Clostridiales bacterium]|nr:hypothetical protein [Clostridiales bacterium]